MSLHFATIAERARADGVITPEEVMALRRVCWDDNAISQEEAEAIFAANDALTERTPEWVDFFVEALAEFTVNQLPPRGYVSQANGDWLMRCLDNDGQFGTMAECELLVRVFEIAKNVPVDLKLFAMERIEQAVLTGEGPTRRGGSFDANAINATEAQILRRFVFAPASDRPAAVGAREAELLFRLKDASLGQANDPEWKRLFVQGVANFLMGFVGANAQISRERAIELNAVIAEDRGGIGSMIGRAWNAKGNVLNDAAWGVKVAFGGDPEKHRIATRNAGVEREAALEDHELEWLYARIEADGEVDEYEQALLDFLAEEEAANR